MKFILNFGMIAIMATLSINSFAIKKTKAKRKPSSVSRALCVLIVDAKTYLNEECNFAVIDQFGGFSIGFGENTSDTKYFATVNSDGTASGKGKGAWNGVEGASHAHDEISSLKRNGNCWTNAKTVICGFPYDQSAVKPTTVCGTLRLFGSDDQIEDGIYNVYISGSDLNTTEDPKEIVKEYVSRRLKDSCVCLTGPIMSFRDSAGVKQHAFKRLDGLKTCKSLVN